MKTRVARWLAALCGLALVSTAGCPGTGNPGRDGDADAGRDGDADEHGDEADGDGLDAEPDGDAAEDAGEPLPGPMTLVATHMEVTAERMCDIDGDGDLDNAIADVGSAADLILMVLNSGPAGTIDDGLRFVFHAPWVDDLRGPDDESLVLLNFRGINVEETVDLTDDFSGVEPFYASYRDLDACGEPLFGSSSVELAGGELRATEAAMILPLTVIRYAPMRLASLEGTVATGGASAELRGCGALLIEELGDLPFPGTTLDLTLLELLTAGGAPAGLPMVSGVMPDLDLDEDGLERIELDVDFHVARCIDGDTSVIEGPDCWQDPRMADGFGISTAVSFVSSTFAGREPGWERRVTGTCETPPEESLFDPR